MFGVFHTKEEFVHAALQCDRPMDQLFGLDDLVIRCLFRCLTQGPEVIVRDRIAFFTKWSARAAQLKGQEASLHKSLPADVASVLQGKNLLLLEEVAASVGWTDVKVFKELRVGFDLIGDFDHTGVFAREIRPRPISTAELKASFKFLKPALIGKVKSQACDENSAELWAKTCAEAQGGLLIGPLTEAQVDERFGSSWVPVRRFAVLQSSQGKRKLRPIDDFSENRINMAFGCADKLDLRALDEITGIIRIWTSAVRGGPVIRWHLSDGSTGSSWVPRLTS